MKKRFRNPPYIRYSNCYEDESILLKYLNENDTVLSIASAGDNSLAILGQDVKKVYMIDMNPVQLYLCELKLMGIKYLEYQQFLILIGHLKGDSWSIYLQIAQYLSPLAKEYFDQQYQVIQKIKLIHCGRFEYYLNIFHHFIRLICSKRRLVKFLNMTNPEEQVRFYEHHLNNRRFKFLSRFLFSEKTLSKYGRDKSFFKYSEGSLKDNLLNRFKLCLSHVPNNTNQYLNYSILNKLGVLPYYLQPENFAKIKKNADKVEFILGDIKEIAKYPLKFDFLNLSDIFEYLSAEETRKLEDLIAVKSNSGARIVFWNMMVERKFESNDFVELDSNEDFINDKGYFYQALRIYRRS